MSKRALCLILSSGAGLSFSTFPIFATLVAGMTSFLSSELGKTIVGGTAVRCSKIPYYTNPLNGERDVWGEREREGEKGSERKIERMTDE